MITIEQQIEAVDSQIKALKSILAKNADADWANTRILELIAVKRTLAQLRVIGKGVR